MKIRLVLLRALGPVWIRLTLRQNGFKIMTRLQTATLRKRETLGRRRETLLKVTASHFFCQTPTHGTFLWRWDLTRLPAQKQPSLSLWHPATSRTCEERRSNTSAAAFSSLFSSFCLFFLPRNEACRAFWPLVSSRDVLKRSLLAPR